MCSGRLHNETGTGDSSEEHHIIHIHLIICNEVSELEL